MIRCPKCGVENMIGAIFCRGCGEKLDLDSLKPDEVQKAAKKVPGGGGGAGGGLLKKLFIIFIFFPILGILIAIFIPPAVSEPPVLGGPEFEAAWQRLRKLVRSNKKGAEHTFTIAEVNAVAREMLGLTPEALEEQAAAAEEAAAAGEAEAGGLGAGQLVPVGITINLLDTGQVKFVAKWQAFNFIPLRGALVGDVTASESGLWFTPTGVYAGRMPVYGAFLQDPMIERFNSLVAQNQTFQDRFRPVVGTIVLNPPNEVRFRRK